MTALIVGGTSGLGLEIGSLLCAQGVAVYATGRSLKALPGGMQVVPLNITDDVAKLLEDLDHLVSVVPHLDLVIYAAGSYEQGHLSELSDAHIAATANVGIMAPALLLKRIITKQGSLGGFIAITSTSQWRPREQEAVYAATKAGLAMLAQSASLDPLIKKTLVVGPAGMDTAFWTGTGRNAHGLLSPHWVAQKVLKLWDAPYVYRLARILRDPTPEDERVQILETRADGAML